MRGFIEIEAPDRADLRYLININHIITIEQIITEDFVSESNDSPANIESTKIVLNIIDKTGGQLNLVRSSNCDDYKVFSSENEYRTIDIEKSFDEVLKMIQDAQA